MYKTHVDNVCSIQVCHVRCCCRLWPCVDTVQAARPPSLYYYSCKCASQGKFVCNSPELEALTQLSRGMA